MYSNKAPFVEALDLRAKKTFPLTKTKKPVAEATKKKVIGKSMLPRGTKVCEVNNCMYPAKRQLLCQAHQVTKCSTCKQFTICKTRCSAHASPSMIPNVGIAPAPVVRPQTKLLEEDEIKTYDVGPGPAPGQAPEQQQYTEAIDKIFCRPEAFQDKTHELLRRQKELTSSLDQTLRGLDRESTSYPVPEFFYSYEDAEFQQQRQKIYQVSGNGTYNPEIQYDGTVKRKCFVSNCPFEVQIQAICKTHLEKCPPDICTDFVILRNVCIRHCRQGLESENIYASTLATT